MPSDMEPPTDPTLLVEWARNRLRKAAPRAVRSIIELAEMADSEQVRLQASKDLLGMVGLTQKQQVEVDHGIKASQEEVNHELEQTLKRLEAGRQKALPPAPEEDLVVVENPEEVSIEKPSEEGRAL